MKQFILTHKKPVIIVAIFALIIAVLCFIYAAYVVKAAEPTPVSVSSEPTSSVADSSAAVSSAPVVVVPKIEPPVSSATPSKESASSAAVSSAPSALPKVNIEADVADKKETPIEKPTSKPAVSSEASKNQGSTTPQPNPEFAKTPNRNMPSFTVDTSIVGASGAHHGDFDGDSYYHAGLDMWVDEETWFVDRFGQHPNATESDIDYFNTNQFSPFQQDGDYKSTPNGGDYFCKPCHGWVLQTAWENGKHGSGRNHIANTKKMAG